MPQTTSNLQPRPTLTMTMTDDALVVFDAAPTGPNPVTFHETGYMPVTSLTISGVIPGISQYLGGKLDGMFIHYAGSGVENFANGFPSTVDYTSLHYELIGYKGHATFGQLTDGTPTVSGLLQQVVLTQGDLIAGHLAFTATGGVAGEVDVSVLAKGINVGALDIAVQHDPQDLGFASKGLTLKDGHLTATFVPLTTS